MAYYYFLKVVVYQYGQSRISGGFGPLRMIGSDGSEVTGSDVIGPEVTESDVTEVCSAHARISPRFLLTIVVVQNVPFCITDMVTGCDVTEGHVTG
jgi:hypothetical protein